MRLSSLSLTFLSTPGGLSRRPGSGRRWFVASSITAAAPGLLPRLLGPGEGGRRDGSQSTRGCQTGRRGYLQSPRLPRCGMMTPPATCRLAVPGRGSGWMLVSSPKDTKLSASITLTGRHITDTPCSKCVQDLKYLESEGCEGGTGE